MKRFSILLFAFVGCVTCLAADQKSSTVDVPGLRAKANEIFGPLPDRMPGAEKDTPEMVVLGEKLYFEKALSHNGKMSCNDCHLVDQSRAGVDNEATSLGVHG